MWIKGKDLTAVQRAQVLAAFVYRHLDTTVTEEEWVLEHAFDFVKDGSRLSKVRKYCVPHYMAD